MKFLRTILGKNADEPAAPPTSAQIGPDPVLSGLAELEIKRLREALAAASPQKRSDAEIDAEDELASSARPHRVVKTKAPLPEGAKATSVNIWDLEDEAPPSRRTTSPPLPEVAPGRPVRSRTRVLGFDSPPAADVVSLFEAEDRPVVAKPVAAQSYVMFPVGWLAVKSGPGQGSVFTLEQGVSQIGRGTDQTVALDFGDMTVSRQNHAAIAYDAQTHQFHIGHGGKANLVRLNGKPLLSTEPIIDGDVIQIGETTLVLKVLCTPAFNWSKAEAGGDGHDMAIA